MSLIDRLPGRSVFASSAGGTVTAVSYFFTLILDSEDHALLTLEQIIDLISH